MKNLVFAILFFLPVFSRAACIENSEDYNLRLAVYFLILLSPVLVMVLKIKSDIFISFFLAGQVVGYLYYDSGISGDCNIRADFVFAAISILWMLFKLSASKEK